MNCCGCFSFCMVGLFVSIDALLWILVVDCSSGMVALGLLIVIVSWLWSFVRFRCLVCRC